MQICERLKEARKNTGMTQEEVAERVLVSRATISSWENGKTLPDIASLISLSDLYNISLDELIIDNVPLDAKRKAEAKNTIILKLIPLPLIILFKISAIPPGTYSTIAIRIDSVDIDKKAARVAINAIKGISVMTRKKARCAGNIRISGINNILSTFIIKSLAFSMLSPFICSLLC